jgi:phosphate:Na+ symporter
MKVAMEKVTNKPAIGFLFGMLVTCMIQSSTATIVLTVGLVGAGLLTFRQSVGIVLGANVGTAITAQIIRLMDVSAGSASLLYFFKADNLAPVALIIGMIFIMFVKKDVFQNAGNILVGFGVLFMGLIFMSAAVSEMGEGLSSLLTKFEGNYILGFLSGVLVTGVIQSSSAVVGILQSMASSVGLTFCGVFAVIIGVNIGDCLTTFIVSRIGATPDQIRTALVHVIYNVLAAILIALIIFIGRQTGLINDTIWYMKLDSGGVANLHGIFRLVPAILFLPFSGAMASLAEKIVPDREVASDEDSIYEEHLRELDHHLISNPTFALDQAATLIGHMADVALHNVDVAFELIFKNEPGRRERLNQREDLIDRMADAANQYLMSITSYMTLDSQHLTQNFLVRALNSFERIGDYAFNVVNEYYDVMENGKDFSDIAMNELEVLIKAIKYILHLTYDAYKTNDTQLAKKVEPMEEVVDALVDNVQNKHINRMTSHTCDIYSGIHFENILAYMERMSDQCSDLAVAILSMNQPGIRGREHEYIHVLHHSGNPEYIKEYDERHDEYFKLMREAEESTAKKTDK